MRMGNCRTPCRATMSPRLSLLLLRQLLTLHDALERPHETFRLVEREPVEMPREHRGRRLADRAALALETNVADATRRHRGQASG